MGEALRDLDMNVGTARARLTPPWGVELAGWGYYLGRTWRRVRDHTAATAVVVDGVAIVGVDIMYADAAFCAEPANKSDSADQPNSGKTGKSAEKFSVSFDRSVSRRARDGSGGRAQPAERLLFRRDRRRRL